MSERTDFMEYMGNEILDKIDAQRKQNKESNDEVA